LQSDCRTMNIWLIPGGVRCYSIRLHPQELLTSVFSVSRGFDAHQHFT
jgi:hypothetical protein